MKIGIIVPGFSANEQDWCIPALLDFVRVLAGHVELHVFTLRWPERRGNYSVFGATVHALDGRENLGLAALLLYGRALEALLLEHRRRPFDVLHAFWADEPGWVTALAGRRLGIPVVISLAGGELIGLRDIGYGVQLRPGGRTMVRWGLNAAARITVGSEYLMRIAKSKLAPPNRSKLRRIPLGVDTKLFSPARPITDSNGPPNTLLNVGSLTPVKGQRELIEALSSEPEFFLRIAGTGPLKSQLTASTSSLGLAQRVEFLGSVAHDKMPEIYRAAGVLVQSSRHEAQGMAVLEAAACGVPVMGTSVGVVPEIGQEAAMGSHLNVEISELLRSGARRRSMSEAAQGRILADYSLEVCLQRFLDLYQELRP